MTSITGLKVLCSRLKQEIRKVKLRLFLRYRSNLKSIARSVILPRKIKWILSTSFENLMIGKDHLIQKDTAVCNLHEVYPEHSKSPFQDLYYIDGQILNGPDFTRGIGRYTLLFTINLARRNPQSSFRLIFTNRSYPSNLSSILEIIETTKLDNLHIQIIDIFGSKKETSLSFASEAITLKLAEANPRAIIVPTFFNDELQVIPFTIPIGTKSIGILHDLIPLQFQKHYLPTKALKEKYYKQFQKLCSSDVIFSVSKNSLDVFERYKKYTGERVVIGGSSTLDCYHLKPSFSERKGVLCVGGSGKSKNVYKLVYGNALVSRDIRKLHPLIILGIVKARDRFFLKSLSFFTKGNVIVRGFVSPEELQDCYLKSRVLVVPSLAEGLSLPVYEMWAHGGIAIGGLRTVLEETIGNPDLLFDPINFDGYSELVSDLLLNEVRWEQEQSRSANLLKERNWDHVISIAESYL